MRLNLPLQVFGNIIFFAQKSNEIIFTDSTSFFAQNIVNPSATDLFALLARLTLDWKQPDFAIIVNTLYKQTVFGWANHRSGFIFTLNK